MIHKIMAMDMLFLYWCGLPWNQAPEPQLQRECRSNVGPAQASQELNRSPSPPAGPDPLDFTKWDVNDMASIPWDKIAFSPDIGFTSNRLFHAVAILFFLDLELPLQHPPLNDALHAAHDAGNRKGRQDARFIAAEG